MIETNDLSTHVAGIIPVAGPPFSFNMPWHDSLIPINENYHAIERAVHTAAMAGCNTIWVVLHKETQPLIKQKLGEWVYDPKTVWVPPQTYWNKREIPVYYVAINAKDRNRRDSIPWSCLYGAKVASYVSKKLSKWVLPKRFLIVSPYGVVDESVIESSRQLLRKDKNLLFSHNGKIFLDNEHLPFTFSQEEYLKCSKHFKEIYTGDDRGLNFSDIFNIIDLNKYNNINLGWYYKLTNWQEYRSFISSEHNLLCQRPKYMVTHKWWGFIKDS